MTASTETVPRDPGLDSTFALLREGYEFIPNRCRRLGRLRDAADGTAGDLHDGGRGRGAFYEPGRLTRAGALPPTALTLLQDKGSVALLDGDAHRQRKDMFLGLLGPSRFDGLIELMTAELETAGSLWQRRDSVVLYTAAQEILCRAVCSWAGVPLEESQVSQRTSELAAMFEGAGSVGRRHWRGQLLRSRNERSLRRVIEDARSERRPLPEGSAAHAITWHLDTDGGLLDVDSAAVELINVLRPTVAIAVYITFTALALHEHADAAEQVRTGGAGERERFVQEVRRFYPFFPLVGGRVKTPFEWNGIHFPPGRRVLLDLYGTNRDSRHWDDPGRFRPERFRAWKGDPYTLIPQGGGDHSGGHRCPGEWITIAVMSAALEFLSSISYDVPQQDLSVDLSRMPALPRSGLVIESVRGR